MGIIISRKHHRENITSIEMSSLETTTGRNLDQPTSQKEIKNSVSSETTKKPSAEKPWIKRDSLILILMMTTMLFIFGGWIVFAIEFHYSDQIFSLTQLGLTLEFIGFFISIFATWKMPDYYRREQLLVRKTEALKSTNTVDTTGFWSKRIQKRKEYDEEFTKAKSRKNAHSEMAATKKAVVETKATMAVQATEEHKIWKLSFSGEKYSPCFKKSLKKAVSLESLNLNVGQQFPVADSEISSGQKTRESSGSGSDDPFEFTFRSDVEQQSSVVGTNVKPLDDRISAPSQEGLHPDNDPKRCEN